MADLLPASYLEACEEAICGPASYSEVLRATRKCCELLGSAASYSEACELLGSAASYSEACEEAICGLRATRKCCELLGSAASYSEACELLEVLRAATKACECWFASRRPAELLAWGPP